MQIFFSILNGVEDKDRYEQINGGGGVLLNLKPLNSLPLAHVN